MFILWFCLCLFILRIRERIRFSLKVNNELDESTNNQRSLQQEPLDTNITTKLAPSAKNKSKSNIPRGITDQDDDPTVKNSGNSSGDAKRFDLEALMLDLSRAYPVKVFLQTDRKQVRGIKSICLFFSGKRTGFYLQSIRETDSRHPDKLH